MISARQKREREAGGVAIREIASLSIIRFSKLGRKWEMRSSVVAIKRTIFLRLLFYLFYQIFRRGSIYTDQYDRCIEEIEYCSSIR